MNAGETVLAHAVTVECASYDQLDGLEQHFVEVLPDVEKYGSYKI